MPAITFEADTQSELAAMVRAWKYQPDGSNRTEERSPADEPGDSRLVREVVAGMTGRYNRPLLWDLATASLNGEYVPLTQGLVESYGFPDGGNFGGVVGSINRRANRLLGRLLVEFPGGESVWTVSEPDARVILDVLGSRPEVSR